MNSSSTLVAVNAISDAFADGAARFETWRKAKKNRKSGEAELSDSLESGAPDIKAEYEKLRERYGDGFERGDETSQLSLFGIANELNRTLVNVLKSESIPRYEFEPSALWQVSEKCRKQALLRLSELGLRVLRNQETASPHVNGSAGFRGAMPPLSTASSWSVNRQTTSSYGHDRSKSVAMMLEKVKYSRPARYSMSGAETYIRPEAHYGLPDWSVPKSGPIREDGIYSPPAWHSMSQVETSVPPEDNFSQPDWSTPKPEPIWEDTVYSHHTQYSMSNTQTYEQPKRDYIHSSTPRPEHQFQQETPRPLQMNKDFLPPSLQIGSPTSPNYPSFPRAPPQPPPPSSLRPHSPEYDEYPSRLLENLTLPSPPIFQEVPAPPPKSRPFSVSYSSPPIPDLGSSSSRLPMPHPWDPQQSPVSATPTGRLRMPDQRASEFNQEVRGPQDVRRATIGYSRSPFQENYQGGFATPSWSPQPVQQEQQRRNTENHHSSVSPQQNFLEVSQMGHFRMPTPVNHGGHELQN